jgi:predicted TIM-barrel fold metal-dependent hydrolase
MDVIDPHHHFWRMTDIAFLRDHRNDGFVGNIEPIRHDYSPADLAADADTLGITLRKSVAIQAGYDVGPANEETAWLQSVADDPSSDGFPHGIVGHADFSDPNVEALLAAHVESANLRGIRQTLCRSDNPAHNHAPRDFLSDATWRKNIGLLERFDLSLDFQLFPHQMAAGVEIVREHPNLQFILTHTGIPESYEADYFDTWESGVRLLAAEPNVAVKISGASTFARDWTVETIRPLVLRTIELFGVDRCMFASNFPVAKLATHWKQQWSAYDELTHDFDESDRRKLFHDNADRFYRLS